MAETLTGASALIRALEHEGVEVVFGVPGGAILPAYDPILDSSIRHILARHEQGAGHMASGYAHATGKVGVVMATSGPGATNLITPLQDAQMDSIPVVAITGQVPTTAIGNDAFQEAHTWGISMPCTKHNYLITRPEDIPDVIREAFHLASTGRPGPVLVDIPKDVLASTLEWHSAGKIDLPGYRPSRKGHPKQVRSAVDLVMASESPILYAGGGVMRAEASEQLVRFAELADLPTVTTLMARGVIPDSHPLALGMPGMHGNYTAITSMQKADLLISVGARFDDRVTGDPDHFATGSQESSTSTSTPPRSERCGIPRYRSLETPKIVLGQLIDEARKPSPRSTNRRRRSPPSGSRPSPSWQDVGIHCTYDQRPRRPYPAAVRDRRAPPPHQRRRHSRLRGGPAPDVGLAVLEVSNVRTPGSTRVGWGQWVTRFQPPSEPRSPRTGRARVCHRRRRMLPDDAPGADHRKR